MRQQIRMAMARAQHNQNKINKQIQIDLAGKEKKQQIENKSRNDDEYQTRIERNIQMRK